MCPVDCIHPRKMKPVLKAARQTYINPVECIDCGALCAGMSVTAIFALEDLPEVAILHSVEFDWYAKK
jgi:ferredoxin